MNLEELSKSQLILLTILVNFVMSVATGILTVSLLDQAPPVVTQTVNRIVEHTIETVGESAPATVVKAPTAAPSTEDLVTTAIAASAGRLAWIYDPQVGTSTNALALATYLPKSRAVVTSSQAALPKEILVEFTGGKSAPASLSHEGNGIRIYGFADNATLPAASSPLLLASKELRLGATVLAIGTDGSAVTGIISRVADDGVHTTLPDVGEGVAAVDLSGNLVGISKPKATGVFMSSDLIRSLLTASSTASESSSSSSSS